MNEEQKARFYLKQLYEAWPKHFVEKLEQKSRGLGLILNYIAVSTDVCAGDISKEFNVSTARVAVILKTLVKKGLVETSTSANDRRKVIVKITENGLSELNSAKNDLVAFMLTLMSKIGEDDLKEFIRIFAKINQSLDCGKCDSQTQVRDASK